MAISEPKLYTVQEAANISGVSAHTLRYYERTGLLAPIAREQNGHRRYTQDDLNWVHFLTLLRVTDMPIAQMKRYMELVRTGAGTEDERLALFEAHRTNMLEKIETLTSSLVAIERKIAFYRGGQEACIEPERGSPDELEA